MARSTFYLLRDRTDEVCPVMSLEMLCFRSGLKLAKSNLLFHSKLDCQMRTSSCASLQQHPCSYLSPALVSPADKPVALRFIKMTSFPFQEANDMRAAQ